MSELVVDDEPEDLIVRLLAASRDLEAPEDLRLLCGEAAAEIDRLRLDFAAMRELVINGGNEAARRDAEIDRLQQALGECTGALEVAGRLIEWVSVDQRLPPEGVRVLVYVPTCDLLPIQADEWNEQREDPTGMGGPTISTGFAWDEHEFEEVTHWMYLPSPPVLAGPPATPESP